MQSCCRRRAFPPQARFWNLGYAHGEVFRRSGTTYVLVTPVNQTSNFYLKRPQPDGTMRDICSWFRVEVHM
jgi:hypothetical protein